MRRTVLKRAAAVLAAAAFAPFIAACATVPAAGPSAGAGVVLERDFRGRLYADGRFRNAITGSERPFKVVLDGRWDGRNLTLREAFAFADGEKDVKTWVFTRTGPGTYTGTREDVVGTARVVTEAGAVRLSYDVVLGGSQVHFEDVIERGPGGAILNRAIVSKFGVPVGSVDLTFARRPL